jgi:hypothetical protein
VKAFQRKGLECENLKHQEREGEALELEELEQEKTELNRLCYEKVKRKKSNDVTAHEEDDWVFVDEMD